MNTNLPNFNTLEPHLQVYSQHKILDTIGENIKNNFTKKISKYIHPSSNKNLQIFILIIKKNKIIKIFEFQNLDEYKSVFSYLNKTDSTCQLLVYIFDKKIDKHKIYKFKQLYIQNIEYNDNSSLSKILNKLNKHKYILITLFLVLWTTFFYLTLEEYGIPQQIFLMNIQTLNSLITTQIMTMFGSFTVVMILFLLIFMPLIPVIIDLFNFKKFNNINNIVDRKKSFFDLFYSIQNSSILLFILVFTFFTIWYPIRSINQNMLKNPSFRNKTIELLPFDSYRASTGFPRIVQNNETFIKYYLAGNNGRVTYFYNLNNAKEVFDKMNNHSMMCKDIKDDNLDYIHAYISSNSYLKPEYIDTQTIKDDTNFLDTTKYVLLNFKNILDMNNSSFIQTYCERINEIKK